MTKLTINQRDLLNQAAASETSDIEAMGGSVGASLIKRGMMISIPRAGKPSRLLITEQGRAAIDAPTPLTPPRRPKPVIAPIPKGKIAILVERLQRPEGATTADLMAATGWQAHSVRGAIAGAIKKALGLHVFSEKTDAGRVYRIVADPAA
jgi:hypothetical protein